MLDVEIFIICKNLKYVYTKDVSEYQYIYTPLTLNGKGYALCFSLLCCAVDFIHVEVSGDLEVCL